jgi:hypothetical protein
MGVENHHFRLSHNLLANAALSGLPSKEWDNKLMRMNSYYSKILIVLAVLGTPSASLLAQGLSPLQPNELKAINEQPLVPPQRVMGDPKPLPPETAPKKIIIGPNYQSDRPGEAEAKSLEENSAQPLNPREGLITIPFN